MNTGSSPPRVAVVVPCFDQAHHLEAALQSLRAQGLDSWRAVVVDDGSAAPDEVARVLAGLGDERVALVRHDASRGRAAARNSGLRAARAELVLLLEAQDRLAPDCLERLVAALDADPGLDCVFPDVQSFGRAEGVAAHALPPAGTLVLDETEVPPCAGALLRASFLERLGLERGEVFDEAPELAPAREDFEFWLRALQAGCRGERVAEPLYERRVTYVSFYASPRDDSVADHVLARHRAVFEQAGLADRFRALWYARAARGAYQRRDRRRALELSLRARRLDAGTVGRKDLFQRLLSGSTNRALEGGAVRRAVPLLGYPLHGAARHRPFFVIGLGHSGNALLRRVLCAHDQLHVPPPTWVLGACIAKFERQGRHLSWPDLVSAILAEFAFHPEFAVFELDLTPVVRRMSHAPRHQRNLAALLDAVYRHHAATHGHGCLRWGDDTPLNSLDDALARGDLPKRLGEGLPQTLERLLKVFPDARFLHLCRDGCEVVGSYLRHGVFDDLEAGAARWLHVELQTSRFAARHPERSLDVVYEDLLARPAETLRAVCAFLEVEFQESMCAPLTGASPPPEAEDGGRARALFSAAQRETLQRLLGAALAERGYRPATDVG